MNISEFIPQSNRTSSKLALCLLTAILSLTNCSTDNENLSPKTTDPSAGQEIASVVPEPIAIASPTIREVDPSRSNLPTSNLPTADLGQSAQTSNRIGSVTEFVDFASEVGLSLMPDKAIHEYGASPFYLHPVGNAWVHVEENNGGNYFPQFISNEGHYHLPYQNFDPCHPGDGTTGKPSGEDCLPILHPEKEDRTLFTHNGKQWIKVYANDHHNPKRVFDLLSISVLEGPIQILYKKENGQWFQLASLGKGKRNTSAHTTGITEMLISSAKNVSAIHFDNLEIRMPSN